MLSLEEGLLRGVVGEVEGGGAPMTGESWT